MSGIAHSGLRVETDVGAEAWDEFLASVPGDVVPQTSAWARTKSTRFEHLIVAVREGSDIVAGCLLMRGRIGPFEVVLAPRGPVIAPGSDAVAPFVVEHVLARCPRWRPSIVLLQPVRAPDTLTAAMSQRGFTAAPVDITTPATVEVALDAPEDELFRRLRSSRRRNIRRADGAGLTARRGDHDDLATFLRLHENTARRQGFTPMSHEYLQRQWRALGASGRLSVYLAELDGRALSAATVTAFGDRAVFKLAGLSSDAAAVDLRASDFLHWQIMLDAKRRGFAWYDLGGFDEQAARQIVDGGDVPAHVRSSASQFKLGFGGDVRVLPESTWRLSPGPTRPAQRAIASLAARSPRAHKALMRFRE